MAAIWVALTSAAREHQRTIDLRNEEWARQDAALRMRTARLARAFQDELSRTALVIRDAHTRLRSCLGESGLRMDLLASGLAQVARGLDYHGLVLMDRFSGELDGFSEIDGIAILNTLSNWAHLNRAQPAIDARMLRDAQIEAVIRSRLRDYELMTTLMKELSERLEEYFMHIPSLIVSDDRGVRSSNA